MAEKGFKDCVHAAEKLGRYDINESASVHTFGRYQSTMQLSLRHNNKILLIPSDSIILYLLFNSPPYKTLALALKKVCITCR